MPRLMRRRLLCFYCGGRSTQEYLPTMRLWECEICDAPNHLDEQGDITDPPPHESLPLARFAQQIPRPSSPEFAPPDESLFCQTCLQNQRFLTETLASYFPSSSDPEYPEYEKNYPEYRKNLEDRYPQVCQKCEPRVRNRIRITGYAAKTDHLRRMMERSRGSDRNYHGWTWKRVALFIGAVGWYTSIAGQILWDLGGALTIEGDEREDGLRDDASPSMSTCLAQSWISGRATFACSHQLDVVAGLALGLGFLSIWWNPRFKERLERGSGRILGLTEYYKLQFLFLVLRFGSYAALTRSPTYDFDAGTRRAMHSFMIMFTMISALISFRSIQLDLAPRVLFHDGITPLIQQSQDLPSEGQYGRSPGQNRSETPKTRSAVQPRPFPLNDLAPDHVRSRPLPYNPPTPPPDADGFEEMDWTPSQQPLQPAPKYQMTMPKIAPQPSPFYGHLPPAPLSQAHKLRNPPNQPTFRQATVAQKQSFFNRRLSQLDRDNMSEASTECFDSPTKTVNQSEVASPRFAEPRFFPPSDYETDTGLESIFSKAFSIAEEPHELRVARELKQQQQSADGKSLDVISPKLQALSFVTLAFSFLAWIFALSIPRLAVQIRLICLGVAAIVAGRGLLETVQRGKVYWRWSDMFVYSLELCSSVFLGKASKLPPKKGNSDELSMAGIAFLGIMFLQELWVWVSELEPTAPVSPTPLPKLTPTKPVVKSLSPKKKGKQSVPVVIAPPESNSLVVTSDRRITRSKSRPETMSAAATNGLGGLSLGGSGGGGSGGDDDEAKMGRGNGVRSRRK